jgi:hypothetical protein
MGVLLSSYDVPHVLHSLIIIPLLHDGKAVMSMADARRRPVIPKMTGKPQRGEQE